MLSLPIPANLFSMSASAIWHLASGIALALAMAMPLRAGEAKAPNPLAVEQALDDLASGDWILQWKALRQLADWKVADAAPVIRDILAKDKRPWVRGRALVALAELLGGKVFDDVRSAADHGVPELRAAAVEALGIIGDERAAAIIANRLADKAPTVRRQAIVALARIRRKAAWDTIVKHLGDEDPEMVAHATLALGYVGTPEAAAKLLELLKSDQSPVRGAAVRTLGELRAPDAVLPLLDHMARDGDSRVRDAAREALRGYEPDALAGPMMGVLRGEETHFYVVALQVLTLRPSAQAGRDLAALLQTPDKRYTSFLPYALDALSHMDPDAHLDAIARYLRHEDRTVRLKAVGCVARSAKANPFVLLKHCLTAKDSGTRYLAYKAMKAAKDHAPPEGIVAFVAPALRGDDAKTVKSAISLLEDRITREEVPAAVEALGPLFAGPDSDTRRAALKALERVVDADASRRIAAAQGYVTDWMLIGSFPSDHQNKGFDTVYPPEREIDFTKRYESHTFGLGARFERADVTCAGERKRALRLRPPYQSGRVRTGSILVAFPLTLPEREGLKLTMQLGLEDGAAGDGVKFLARIGEALLLTYPMKKPGGWQPAEADLAAYAGKTVTLELIVDGVRQTRKDYAVIGEPRIVAGDDVVADLVDLWSKAKPRISIPGRTDQLEWTAVRVEQLDGRLEIHDLLGAPIQYRAAYLVADLRLAAEAKARLELEHDDGVKLWLNGTQLAAHKSRGNHTLDATLPAGRLRFLIKTTNLAEWWRVRLRITDPKGRRLDGLESAAQ